MKIPLNYIQNDKVIIKSGKIRKKNRFGFWNERTFVMYYQKNKSDIFYLSYISKGCECRIELGMNQMVRRLKIKSEFQIIDSRNDKILCHLKFEDFTDALGWMNEIYNKDDRIKRSETSTKRTPKVNIFTSSPISNELVTTIGNITGKKIESLDSDDDMISNTVVQTEDDINKQIRLEFEKITYESSSSYLQSFANAMGEIIKKIKNGVISKENVNKFITPELVIIFNDLVSNGSKTEKLNLKDLKNIGVILESENIAENLYNSIDIEIPAVITDLKNTTITDGTAKVKTDLEKFVGAWVTTFYKDNNIVFTDLLSIFFEYLRVFDSVGKGKIFIQLRKNVNSIIYELVTYKITYEFVEKSLTISDENILIRMIKILDSIPVMIKKFCIDNGDIEIYSLIYTQTKQALKIVTGNYCDSISFAYSDAKPNNYISPLLSLVNKSDFYNRQWTKILISDNCSLLREQISKISRSFRNLNEKDALNYILANYAVLYFVVCVFMIKKDKNIKYYDNVINNISMLYDFMQLEDSRRTYYIRRILVSIIENKNDNLIKEDKQFLNFLQMTVDIVDNVSFDLFNEKINE